MYEIRCSFELTCYQHLSTKPLENILFVGAGAVPVSAIIASTKGFKVAVVERDDKAIVLSKHICSRLGVLIDHVHEDLYNYKEYRAYDLIVISGKVGVTTKQKQNIAMHIINNCGNSTILQQFPASLKIIINQYHTEGAF